MLQAKKGGGDHGNKEAEMAESLLLANKPFTDLTTLLTQLVSSQRNAVHALPFVSTLSITITARVILYKSKQFRYNVVVWSC